MVDIVIILYLKVSNIQVSIYIITSNIHVYMNNKIVQSDAKKKKKDF